MSASSAEQWAKVKAMVQAGKVERDIVSVTDAIVDANRELLAALDCRAILNAATQGADGARGPNRLLRTIGGSVLAYSAEAFPPGKHPQSWADFWDVERFPGPRGLRNAGAP